MKLDLEETVQASLPTKHTRHFSENQIGYTLLSPQKGESYIRREERCNTLAFVLNGKIRFSYNDFLNRSFEKGDIFFVPQAADMYAKATADAEILMITYENRTEAFFDSGMLTHYTNAGAIDIEYDFRPLKSIPVLSQFVESVRNYMLSDVQNGFLYELKLKELFVILGHCYTTKEVAELFYPALAADAGFKSKILEICHEGLGVEELAERFNMSPRNFSRKFKQEFGQSVHQWMLEQKSKRIQLKLSIPETTVNDIINEFGFNSSSYFCEYCRRHFGCTPQELIRKVRSSNKAI